MYFTHSISRILLSSVSFGTRMKWDELKFTVLISQVPQYFLARVKLGLISIHIVLINFISKQHQLLSCTKLDHVLNVLIRQNLTYEIVERIIMKPCKFQVYQILLKAPRPCTIFCFAFTHTGSITSHKISIGYGFSSTVENLLCFVHGPRLKTRMSKT